jgi:hypothetical protein
MSKTKKRILIGLVVIVIGAVAVVTFMFNMPHRDVVATEADKEIAASALVNEFLTDQNKANQDYLADDGESKILIVSGTIAEIKEDQQGMKVVLLREGGDKMGVSCTFTSETNHQATSLNLGDNVKIKGVIRSGAEYDEDLDLAEDAILEKCTMLDQG